MESYKSKSCMYSAVAVDWIDNFECISLRPEMMVVGYSYASWLCMWFIVMDMSRALRRI